MYVCLLKNVIVFTELGKATATAIRQHLSEIISNVATDDVMVLLFQEGAITIEDRERIESYDGGDTDKVESPVLKACKSRCTGGSTCPSQPSKTCFFFYSACTHVVGMIMWTQLLMKPFWGVKYNFINPPPPSLTLLPAPSSHPPSPSLGIPGHLLLRVAKV